MKYCALLLSVSTIIPMDYTPPNPLPNILKEKIEKAAEEVILSEQAQRKRRSREHTVVEISGTITDPEGKETKLEFKKDNTLTTSAESDEQKKTYSKKFVIGTNCVSVICTALIGAGVTIAVKFAECKKD